MKILEKLLFEQKIIPNRMPLYKIWNAQNQKSYNKKKSDTMHGADISRVSVLRVLASAVVFSL